MQVSEGQPDILYPYWNVFVGLLDSDNTFMRSGAVAVIVNLTAVDRDRSFENLFLKYYSLLDDPSMIIAANDAGHSSRIAQAKPHLQTKLTNRLVAIDDTHHGNECRNIIKGNAIQSFDRYYGTAKNKKAIVDFVKKEAANTRRSTQKKAETFIKKWALACISEKLAA